MNKTELVEALLKAGLRPEDLQDEYARAEAAQKKNEKLREARAAAAKTLMAYSLVVNPDLPLTEKDLKDFEAVLEEAEKPLAAIKIRKVDPKDADDAISNFLNKMGW